MGTWLRDWLRRRGHGAPAAGEASLVSCIMPTYNRRPFVARAIDQFRRQDYPSKQLIVVDDGEERVRDLVLGDPTIRYIGLTARTSIGEKRNIAVAESSGQIIVHWDDDDWYDARRLGYQVAPLLSGAAEATALKMSFMYDLASDAGWFVDLALHQRMFFEGIHTGSLAYRREIWEDVGGFPGTDLAEDVDFIRTLSASGGRLLKLPNDAVFAGLGRVDATVDLPLLEEIARRCGGSLYPPRRPACVYVRHTANAWQFTCGEYLDPAGWHRVPPLDILPADDLGHLRSIAQTP